MVLEYHPYYIWHRIRRRAAETANPRRDHGTEADLLAIQDIEEACQILRQKLWPDREMP